jgi:hypothetical protein
MRRIFDEIDVHPVSKGLLMRERTIVEATPIAAPLSTKSGDQRRHLEMN